jgi:hypothetical protein
MECITATEGHYRNLYGFLFALAGVVGGALFTKGKFEDGSAFWWAGIIMVILDVWFRGLYNHGFQYKDRLIRSTTGGNIFWIPIGAIGLFLIIATFYAK